MHSAVLMESDGDALGSGEYVRFIRQVVDSSVGAKSAKAGLWPNTFKSTGCYRLHVWSGSFAGLGRYAHLGLTLPTYDH